MNENKVAVAVNCSVDRDGVTVPLLICWKDGRQFPIERVLHVCMEEDEEGERIRYAVTVKDILKRPEYMGYTVNFRTTSKSYKEKKNIINTPDKWAVFENTQEGQQFLAQYYVYNQVSI